MSPTAPEIPWRTSEDRSDTRPRILLIGATGQVGWELGRSLQPLGEVVPTRRPRGRSQRAAPGELDLGHPETIRPVIDALRPQLIVNAAAFTAVEQAELDERAAMTINSVAPGLLAEAARRSDAALVHFSSDYVFDGSGHRRWREEDIARPINVYGRSKLSGEEAIERAGADHLILRTSWIYGLLGRNFVGTMLRLACQERTLRIVADQVGAPTSARVVAEITAQILAQARGRFGPFLARYGGLLHICCQGETTWHAFAMEIFHQARLWGLPLTVREVQPVTSQEYGAAVERPRNSRLDCHRLRQRFGLVAPAWQVALQLSLEERFRLSLPAAAVPATSDPS